MIHTTAPYRQQRLSLTRRGPLFASLLFAAILTASQLTTATNPSGGSYEIQRQVVASGGGQASNGALVIIGTVGQHEASTPVSGGSFVVHSGFHTPTLTLAPAPDALFKNSFEN